VLLAVSLLTLVPYSVSRTVGFVVLVSGPHHESRFRPGLGTSTPTTPQTFNETVTAACHSSIAEQFSTTSPRTVAAADLGCGL
jgi:hypothetical protein